MKKLALILILILCSGCVGFMTSGQKQVYEQTLNTCLGACVEDLFSSWGEPDSISETPNGNKIYTYSHSYKHYSPPVTHCHTGGAPPAVHTHCYTTGGHTVNLWCNTSFEVDITKTIIDYKWGGNNCSTGVFCEEGIALR